MSNPKSDVWKHMRKLNENEIQCKYCPKILKNCKNTTNLWNHLTTQHQIFNSKSKSLTESAEVSESTPGQVFTAK